MSPSAPGPMIAPVMRKPTAGGILSRRLGRSTRSAALNAMTRSRRTEDSLTGSGAPDEQPREEHERSPEYDLKRRRGDRGVHVPVTDVADRAELGSHHGYREGDRHPKVGHEERE